MGITAPAPRVQATLKQLCNTSCQCSCRRHLTTETALVIVIISQLFVILHSCAIVMIRQLFEFLGFAAM